MQNELANTVEKIKKDILRTRNKIFENANLELIGLYFRIGQVISENSKYGNQFVDNLSVSLKVDFPDAHGFSRRNLFRMKKFYDEYKGFSIVPPAVAQLPWTHNCILIDKIQDIDKRLWYAKKTLENGWTRKKLLDRIVLFIYISVRWSPLTSGFNPQRDED